MTGVEHGFAARVARLVGAGVVIGAVLAVAGCGSGTGGTAALPGAVSLAAAQPRGVLRCAVHVTDRPLLSDRLSECGFVLSGVRE